MQVRLDWKLALLYTLLVLQVLIVMIYVSSTPHMSDLNAPALRDTVTFVDLPEAPQVCVYFDFRSFSREFPCFDFLQYLKNISNKSSDSHFYKFKVISII